MRKCLLVLVFIAALLRSGFAASELEWLMLIESETDTWSRDQVSRYLEKKYDFDITFIEAQDSGATALMVMLASNNAPDLITIPRDSFRIQQMIKQDMIWNLEELACAGEIISALGEELADANRNTEGKLYVFPGGVRMGERKEIVLSLPAMLVREDILEKVEYSADTPEDFVRSIGEITELSEVGLGLMPFESTGCLSLDRYLPESLGLSDRMTDRPWLLMQEEEYTAWLRGFSQIYRNGGMDREVFTIDIERIRERISKGEYGCFWGDTALLQEEIQEAESRGYRYVAVEPPKGSAPGYILDRTKDIGLYATVIPKNADDPELSASVLYELGSEQGHQLVNDGVEGMMWSKVGDGKEIHASSLELFGSNIAKFNLINGGACKYDFLACYDKIDFVYGAGVLDAIYAFCEPCMQDDAASRKAGLAALETCVKEVGLMSMRWGDELPLLLARDAEEFEMAAERMREGFTRDGLERYESVLGSLLAGKAAEQ